MKRRLFLKMAGGIFAAGFTLKLGKPVPQPLMEAGDGLNWIKKEPMKAWLRFSDMYGDPCLAEISSNDHKGVWVAESIFPPLAK